MSDINLRVSDMTMFESTACYGCKLNTQDIKGCPVLLHIAQGGTSEMLYRQDDLILCMMKDVVVVTATKDECITFLDVASTEDVQEIYEVIADSWHFTLIEKRGG